MTTESAGGGAGFLQSMHQFGRAKLGGVPIWVAWGINILAWVFFVSTGNHAIEFIMGLACAFAFYLAFLHSNTKLMVICAFDVVWMWAWAFGLFGDSISIGDLLKSLNKLM